MSDEIVKEIEQIESDAENVPEVTDEEIDAFLGSDAAPEDPEGFDRLKFYEGSLHDIDVQFSVMREQNKVALYAGDKETVRILRERGKILFKKRQCVINTIAALKAETK